MFSPKQTLCIKKVLQLQRQKIWLNSGLLSWSVVVNSESVRSSLTFWLLSRTAFICKSSVFISMEGLINDYEKEEDSEYKLERWLYDKLTSFRIFSSAVATTTAGQQLSSRYFNNALQSVLCTISKPDEWPMTFYENTKKHTNISVWWENHSRLKTVFV